MTTSYRVRHPQGCVTFADGIAGLMPGGARPCWFVDGIAYVSEDSPWLAQYRQTGAYDITEVDAIPADYVTASARLAARPEHSLSPRPGRTPQETP